MEYRRRISFEFQSPLLMAMTVTQNIALGLTFRGAPKDETALLKEDHRLAVFVTHNIDDATKLSHRIAVIVGERLRQVGRAKQIKSKPADETETVAAFLHELPQ